MVARLEGLGIHSERNELVSYFGIGVLGISALSLCVLLVMGVLGIASSRREKAESEIPPDILNRMGLTMAGKDGEEWNEAEPLKKSSCKRSLS